MSTIQSTVPCLNPPHWALLQRRLIDLMSDAINPFLEKYTRDDGSIIWHESWPPTRDGLDDFYESFGNWPLFYLLGGPDEVLDHAHRQWDAVTHQMANMGPYSPVHKEYERGYDQFHQSESYIYFYYLCMADPENEILIERARRFAGFFLNEDPDAQNYDPAKKIILAPHNGSTGPRWGLNTVEGSDRPPAFGYSPGMARYGLPLEHIEGIESYDDLKDPVLAQSMGEAMNTQMGRGDVANNLLVTGLIVNAYLLTDDPKYRDWIVEYVDAWFERARQNGDLLPDNVGLSGEVGEYLGGRWYGGTYGWMWPHGLHNVGAAGIIAACNAFLVTRDLGYFDVARKQLDKVIALGKMLPSNATDVTLREHLLNLTDDSGETFVVPFRHRDAGWFDYQPVPMHLPTAIWNVTQAVDDWQRLEYLRERSGYDWRKVNSFRNKEDNGHEAAWLAYIHGDNPDYPEQTLAAAYEQVVRRIEQQRQDTADIQSVHIHHWQNLNPVTTEALVQLTLGAPQVIYYGGMLFCAVRYFDARKQRPGLPADVAALVEKVEADRVVLRLINLNVFEPREVMVQAGGLGEHRFVTARYTSITSESAYPGEVGSYVTPPTEVHQQTMPVNDRYVSVLLNPATEITIDFELARYAYPPSYVGQQDIWPADS